MITPDRFKHNLPAGEKLFWEEDFKHATGFDTGRGILQNDRGVYWRMRYWGSHWVLDTAIGRPHRKGRRAKSEGRCDVCMFRIDRLRARGGGVELAHLTCYPAPKVALMCLLRRLPKDVAYLIIFKAFNLQVRRKRCLVSE